jgi:hypothetical protein
MARHDLGLPSGPAPADDFDPDAGIDRWVADIDAGRCRVPGSGS